MNKINNILLPIVAIAVAILYFLHFRNNAPTAVINNKPVTYPSGFKIAYFDMDSLQSNYVYYKEVTKELTDLEQKKRSELLSKRNEYQAKIKEYQDKGSSMSQADMAKAEQDIKQRDREYQVTEQMKSSEMQEESFKKLHEVKKRIEDYLKEYNKNKGFSYIFSNAPELIYYKDSTYNITNDLIKGLNAAYKK